LLASICLVWIQAPAQEVTAPFARKPTVSKGPRALGLIQLLPKGKARLTPVAILVDGKFYDAGSYKGTPIPMALDFGVVYEAFRSGVSQGIFKITQPGQLAHTWIAEGTWLAAGAKPLETHKKAEIPDIEDKDAPPRLHKPASASADQPKPATPPETTQATAPTASSKPPSPSTASAPTPPTPSASTSIEDPDRPVLRREKPTAAALQERMKTFDEAAPNSGTATALKPVDLIPAISDAGGPDPRPFTLAVKPAEEVTYRAKMLDLASAELRARTQSEPPSAPATHGTRKAPAAKAPFTDVQLRIFDLSNSNQPVLVFSAKTAPVSKFTKPEAAVAPREITLVARANLEDELRTLFFSVADPQHLELAPHMELIDAVDADGDGRGELLFRRTSDAGSSYAIYRVTADQLWPLYEGTP